MCFKSFSIHALAFEKAIRKTAEEFLSSGKATDFISVIKKTVLNDLIQKEAAFDNNSLLAIKNAVVSFEVDGREFFRTLSKNYEAECDECEEGNWGARQCVLDFLESYHLHVKDHFVPVLDKRYSVNIPAFYNALYGAVHYERQFFPEDFPDEEIDDKDYRDCQMIFYDLSELCLWDLIEENRSLGFDHIKIIHDDIVKNNISPARFFDKLANEYEYHCYEMDEPYEVSWDFKQFLQSSYLNRDDQNMKVA